ncbi:MAG: phosphoribosylaminoimidazolesuccinocarboxamide synthase [Nocardioides sp.]
MEFGRRGQDDRARRRGVLTPDSSCRPAEEWRPGRAQPSYDKQIVRNWLLSPESGWTERRVGRLLGCRPRSWSRRARGTSRRSSG